jgi:hypothetical protein
MYAPAWASGADAQAADVVIVVPGGKDDTVPGPVAPLAPAPPACCAPVPGPVLGPGDEIVPVQPPKPPPTRAAATINRRHPLRMVSSLAITVIE